MITPTMVTEYLNTKIKGVEPSLTDDQLFTEDNFEIRNGRVDYTSEIGGIFIMGVDLSDIPFKFGRVDDELNIENCKVKDLSFLPTEVPYLSFKELHFPKRVCRVWLMPMDYRYILLMKVNRISKNAFDCYDAQSSKEMMQILMGGRRGGVMPSDLIPGKIQQLKELEG